jgi:flagellar protein FlbD
MIALTRMNGAGFVVNAELIKFVEEVPDTIVTLRDGEKLLVRETSEMVVAKAVHYARSLRLCPE